MMFMMKAMKQIQTAVSFCAVFLCAVFLYAAENTAYISPYPQDVTRRALSSLAEISVITFNPGKAVYQTFGHSAIRVSDPVKNIDKLFTFGAIPNIDNPEVLLSALLSKAECIAGAARFGDVLSFDQKVQNRLCIEQKLNVTHEEKEKIYSYLLWKTEEANRAEKYDPVKNNCATAVLEVLKLVWATGIADNHFLRKSASPLSYRSLITAHLSENPWANTAAKLFLGCAADRDAELLDMAFMPDVLRSIIAVSKTKANGEIVPLVKSTARIADEVPESAKKRGETIVRFSPNAPAYFFQAIGICTVVCTVLEIALFVIAQKKQSIIQAAKIVSSSMAAFDILYFFVSGFVGFLVLVFSLSAPSGIVGGNLNFLWLLPTNAVASVFCVREKPSRVLSGYFLAAAYLCVFVLIFREKFPQTIDGVFVPLMIATAVRAVFQALNRPLKAMLQARA